MIRVLSKSAEKEIFLVPFRYNACTLDGDIVHGLLKARTLEEAKNKLHQQDLLIISLKPQRDRTGLVQKLLAQLLSNNTKLRLLNRFVRQLSTLSHVGLPFLTCLQIMAEEAKHSIYKNAFLRLKHDVASGKSLSNALSNQRHLFPPLLVQITAVAEATGNLEKVYDKLGDTYEHELELRRKIASAATYPMLVLLLSFIGVIFVSKVALPQLEELLAYSDVPLPLPTKILLSLAQPGAWQFFLFLFGVLIVLALIFVLTPLGTSIRDCILLRIPVLGPLVLRFHLARVCHILSLCLSCGIPLLNALNIAEQAALNKTLVAKIKSLKAGTQVGLSLTSQLRTMKTAPNFLIQMVRIGEETGSMPEMLQHAGNILDKDIRHALNMTVTWLEPLLIILTGLVVAFVVLGIVMPLLTLMNSLG